ncbi:hypothetical protein BegalDRAFT_2116, partial [Beggiatoa alba B18LD]
LAQLKQEMSVYADPDCTPKRDKNGTSFKSRAIDYCNQIKNLEAEMQPYLAQLANYEQYQGLMSHREKLLNQLATVQQGESTVIETINPTFTAIGKQINMAGDAVKRAILTFTAIATEVLGTFAALVVAILSINQGEKNEKKKGFYRVKVNEAEENQPRLGRYDTGTAEGMNSRFKDVTEAILSGECAPNLSQLQKRFNMGSVVAKDYLSTLAEQGYLVKKDNGQYKLAD